MECSCVAVVSDKGWREKLWTDAFGKPEAPIIPYKTPVCHLPSGVSVCRLLDLPRVKPDELHRLASGIAEHFNLSIAEVLNDMHTVGTPIKLDNTVTVRHCPLHQVILESEL